MRSGTLNISYVSDFMTCWIITVILLEVRVFFSVKKKCEVFMYLLCLSTAPGADFYRVFEMLPVRGCDIYPTWCGF